MKNSSDVLVSARDLIEETGWTQYAMARDCEGHPVDPHHPNAVCFCAAGALRRVVSGDSDETVEEEASRQRAITYLLSAAGTFTFKDSLTIASYNDYRLRTKEMALQWFDKAIALALNAEKENT